MFYRATGPVEKNGWEIMPCPACGAQAFGKQEPTLGGRWLSYGHCETCNTDWERTYNPTADESCAGLWPPAADPATPESPARS